MIIMEQKIGSTVVLSNGHSFDTLCHPVQIKGLELYAKTCYQTLELRLDTMRLVKQIIGCSQTSADSFCLDAIGMLQED